MKRIPAVLALLALPLVAADDSMGDAARKARERREKNAKEGVKAKSYTQDDVQKAPPLANDPNKPAASSGSSKSLSPRSSSGEFPFPNTTVAGQSESAWRSRIATANKRVEDARKEYEYWNSYTLVPGEVLVDDKERPVITSIGQLQAKTAAAKRVLEATEKGLANLEEEARKAGVPPGWLR
jgi:hypothetical protein